MFKVSRSSTFTHDVPVMVPVDNGAYREDLLRTTFRFLDTSEIKKFDLSTEAGTTAFLEAICADFSGLEDDDGRLIVDVNGEIRAALLRRQDVRRGLASYYFDAVGRVKEGN